MAKLVYALLAASACAVVGQSPTLDTADDQLPLPDEGEMSTNDTVGNRSLDSASSIHELYEGVLRDLESFGSIEDRLLLKAHRGTILQHMLDGTEPALGHPLVKLPATSSMQHLSNLSDLDVELQELSTSLQGKSRCMTASLWVAADVVGLALQVAGLHVSYTQAGHVEKGAGEGNE